MRKIIPLFFLMLLVPTPAFAASFTFNPDPLGSVFNMTEKTSFLLDLNTSVSESLVSFSQQQTNLSNLAINNATGMINYTPPASDIGYHGDGVIFIATNLSNSLDFITTKIFFNVSNVNDPPNITAYNLNYSAVSVLENNVLLFNATATDEDLVVGDTINISWYINGGMVQTNLSNATINSTFAFSATYCNASIFNVTVRVNDVAGLAVQQVWNLSVNNSNRVPVLNGTIMNRTWVEDNNLTNNITLSSFFYDPDNQQCPAGPNKDNLTYSVNLTPVSSVNYTINITIDQNSSNVSLHPFPNYNGFELVLFYANDSHNATPSNVVNLTVTNAPDPPALAMLANQTATVNVTFTYIFNATDPDLPYGDSLTWGTNSTIFNITKINATHAMINFTPTVSQVNNYSVWIQVNDTTSLQANGTFFLIVQNNTAPILNFIGNQNATQGTIFYLNVSASDADNDSITFTSNSTFFNITNLNATLGNLTFLPSNGQVGNWSTLFTATDSKGATSSQTIILRVDNINDPPSIVAIASPQIIKVNNTLLINVTASDPDIQWGDILTFGDNTSLFDIATVSSTLGLINFTPNSSQVGNYSIAIHVNDSSGLTASTTFLLAVTNSTAPVLQLVGNYSINEDTYLNIIMNATDADGDPVNFSISTKLFNQTYFNFTFNSTTRQAIFNGTPDQVDLGNHSFTINITDGSNIATQTFWVDVMYINDPPVLPSIINLSAYESTLFLYNLTGYDEEIVLFNASQNLTFFSNNTIFNITKRVNATTMLANFTPTTAQVGNYSVNLTVSDNNSNSSLVFNLFVLNLNDPPYTAGTAPNSTPRIFENQSQVFNINASDPDVVFNESLSIAWIVDGVNQTANINTSYNGTNLTSSFQYLTSFCQAGFHNITAKVSDRANATNITYWNLNVTNVDRVPEYGIRRQSNFADFSNGTFENTSETNSSGNVTLFMINSTSYAAYGSFTSPLFDFGSKFKFSSDLNITHLKRMEWDADLPANTSLLMQFRTSDDGTSFTNWSNNISVTNVSFIYHTVRYVQYRANFFSSSDLSQSPSLNEVRVLYTMQNITYNTNTRYTGIIDLADYFSDPDTNECNGTNKDSLNLSVTGNDSITMRFSGSVITLLETTFEGQDAVQWTGNDSYNRTLSDEVLFTVVPTPGGSVPSSSSSSSSGGGGSSTTTTTIQLQTKLKNVTRPLALNIIVPKPIVIYQNESVSVPIGLVNDENFTLSDIYLSADVPNSTIKPIFSRDYIDRLEKSSSANSTLIINSFKSKGTYEIFVRANVSDPPYLATASFFVSSIELGSVNESQFNTRITFARDLLTENPECLELTEQVTKAQEDWKKGDFKSANDALDHIVNDCRYLITVKDQNLEQPGQQQLIGKVMRFARKPITIAIAVLATLLA
ncbi:MAG: hypothetical protein EPN86_01170, partial [Nanoarchaeota archaeon]